MKPTLEQDWQRVSSVYEKARLTRAMPEATYSIGIEELRRIDRGIDFPLRRLLDSEKYGDKIRCFGAPSGSFPRYPFRWKDSKHFYGVGVHPSVWDSVRVKMFADNKSKGDGNGD